MERINNIIFATDFSDASKAAFTFALEIASRFQSNLNLLHVYEVPNIAPANVFTTLEETESIVSEEMESISNEKLDVLKQGAAAYGINCQTTTKKGNVSEEITKLIDDKTDLLIMGTQGKNASRGLFVGSTANQMIKSASCPVLCIPEKASLNKIDKIAYATNLKFDETETINFIVMLARIFDAEVVMYHVDQKAENEAWSIDILKDLVDKTNYDKIYFREVVTEDVLEGIDSFVKAYGVDIVSATTYNTGFFDRLFNKSYTKEVLMHSDIPILVFNRKKYDTFFL